MRYILPILTSILLMSCTTAKSELNGKSFNHIYLYYSAMNEYGKGGGNQQLVVTFDNNTVTLCNVYENTEATEDGKYKTTRQLIDKYKASYRISSGIVTIDSPIIPEAKIEGDSLIVPKINITIDGEDLSKLFDNALFEPYSENEQ